MRGKIARGDARDKRGFLTADVKGCRKLSPYKSEPT
jgi:hypothetical protein